jgi:hypothetical protein
MFIKQGMLAYIILHVCVAGILIAQDSLLYPEALSPQSMKEYEQEGKVSFRVASNEDINYRLKAQFTYQGFEFYYLGQGGERESEQTTSLAFSNKWINIGVGRGQPHIAKGIILGNTMMRFTPGLTNNAGVRASRISIRNYDYYDELVYLTGSVGRVCGSIFRYDGVYSGSVEYRYHQWLAGLAYYGLERSLIESWVNYKNDQLRASLNASLADKKINHICGDALYKNEMFTLFGAAIYTQEDLIELKSDSQWGSGLKSGSRGVSAGVSLTFSPWKINTIAYNILRADHNEERFMLDMRYKKKPFEINISYSFKNISELQEDRIFPFALTWNESQNHICKLTTKIDLSKAVHVSYQLQGDMRHKRSHVSVFRLTYKRFGSLLRCQLSHCCGSDSDLYFLRPLTPSSYSIRKATNEETIYIDLLYSRNVGNMKIHVLLRNEGVNLGFTIGN